MTDEMVPRLRMDLDFLPIQHQNQQLVLVRDHLGLVPQGKAVLPPLYQIMAWLDGSRTIRDLQMELMRLHGGILVATDELTQILHRLDEDFLLDSERFQVARKRIVDDFSRKETRPCCLSGSAYPKSAPELEKRLDDILLSQPAPPEPEGRIQALVAPHIDFSAGYKIYAKAYQMVNYIKPSRVFVLGVGHKMMDQLYCLTEKDFETPLGIVKNETPVVKALQEAGRDVVCEDDFAHRAEHSIEFQAVFLRHLLSMDFSLIPILCGAFQTNLREYSRDAFLEKAGPLLAKLRDIVAEREHETLVLSGVDFSHIGPKFGHTDPADFLASRAQDHDRRLLEHLCHLDADGFWEESRRVQDRFNVCGFSAMASLLEVIPPCEGRVLDYDMWHEQSTRSAVSFAAVVFAHAGHEQPLA